MCMCVCRMIYCRLCPVIPSLCVLSVTLVRENCFLHRVLELPTHSQRLAIQGQRHLGFSSSSMTPNTHKGGLFSAVWVSRVITVSLAHNKGGVVTAGTHQSLQSFLWIHGIDINTIISIAHTQTQSHHRDIMVGWKIKRNAHYCLQDHRISYFFHCWYVCWCVFLSCGLSNIWTIDRKLKQTLYIMEQ